MVKLQVISGLIILCACLLIETACAPMEKSNETLTPTSRIVGASKTMDISKTSTPQPTNVPTFSTPTPTIRPVSITPTVTFPPTTTQSITPTAITPTPTVRPTLDLYASDLYVVNYLKNNGDCALPCVWGIVPGKTEFEHGIETFGYLGWKGSIYNQTTYYTGKDLLDSTHINIGLYQENDVIQNIIFSFTHKMYALLDQYYSIRNILSTYGVPSQIWINISSRGEVETIHAGFDIFLFYEEAGILAKYPGVAPLMGGKYQICPNHPNSGALNSESFEGSVVIYLGEAGKNLTPKDLAQPFDKFGELLTIEQALGFGADIFYKQIINPTNGQTCFYLERSIWP